MEIFHFLRNGNWHLKFVALSLLICSLSISILIHCILAIIWHPCVHKKEEFNLHVDSWCYIYVVYRFHISILPASYIVMSILLSNRFIFCLIVSACSKHLKGIRGAVMVIWKLTIQPEILRYNNYVILFQSCLA